MSNLADGMYETHQCNECKNYEREIERLNSATADKDATIAGLRKALEEISTKRIELFEDGLAADLGDAGITTLTDAYAHGLNDAWSEAKAIAHTALRPEEKRPNE